MNIRYSGMSRSDDW